MKLYNFKTFYVRDYIMITLGLALYAFGVTAFFLPEKVVMGGVSGIASLVYYQLGVPVAVTNYSINLILLAMAYRVVGRTFVVRTVFGTTVMSVLMGIMQPIFTQPMVTGQPFMNVILGALLCGLGVGIAFIHNGSTGGSDIVAAMVSKHTNVTIGRVILCVDLMIISSSYIIFHSIELLVYGYVILIIISTVCDHVINTNRQAVQFTIISSSWQEINQAITKQANRGCTILHGTGGYTGRDVTMLIVMCRRIEAVGIFRIIKTIDPTAFVAQGNVNGVYGDGFDEIKVSKLKKQHATVNVPTEEDKKHAVSTNS